LEQQPDTGEQQQQQQQAEQQQGQVAAPAPPALGTQGILRRSKRHAQRSLRVGQKQQGAGCEVEEPVRPPGKLHKADAAAAAGATRY
jgi:hypothetical protein